MTNLVVKFRDGGEEFIDGPFSMNEDHLLYVDNVHDETIDILLSEIRNIRMVNLTRAEYREGQAVVEKILEES